MSAAGGSVRTHLKILRVCGFYRLSRTDASGAAGASHFVYRTLTLFLACFYLVQECIYAYQERRDMSKLARVMFLLLCHAASFAKHLKFYWDADTIDRLVALLEEPCFNPGGSGGALARGAAQWARRLLFTYSGCAVATCALWLVFAVVDRLRGRPYEFPFWTCLDQSRPQSFALVLLYSSYVTSLLAAGITTIDAFMAAILDQCKTQLVILRSDFEKLPERAEQVAGTESGDRYNKTVRNMFLDCMTHYDKITETILLFQEAFGTTILIQFGISGWTLCMAAYKITYLGAADPELASMALFTWCMLIQLYLYCYYGNEVTVQSDRVAGSVYSMRWVGGSLQLRRAVLLLLLSRTQRPLRVAAGRVVPLSLDTYVKILKSSYSFYAMLHQTK